MMDEQLSAFLDNESDANTVKNSIRMLQNDAQYRDAWQRHLWLRDVLRAEGAAPSVDTDFADRITAVITQQDSGQRNVIAFPSRQRRWWQRGAGLAAAASVAALALLTLQPFKAMAPSGDQSQAAGSTRIATATVADDAPVSNDRSRATENWTVSDPVLQSRLNGYLVEHASLSSNYGMSGARAGLVRVATYGGNLR